MDHINCIRCRKVTPNIGKPVLHKDKRGKPYAVVKCAVCGSKKIRFISSKQNGNGIFGRILGGLGGSYFGGPIGAIAGQEIGSNLPF